MAMDAIVISGISGRFPGCDNTEELQKALVEGVDLVSDNHGRWPKDFFGLNNRGGIMKDIEHFDIDFFGVPPRQADGLDPRTRIMMEATFEAIVDAGLNPLDVKGTKTGLFIGMSTFRGNNNSLFENKVNYIRLGQSLAIASGSIAFVFDLKGPSYCVDTACSSSLIAFCQAFRAIRSGECDAAFVCGASIVLDPYDSLEYKTLNILSPTGKCKFLDEDRDGFVKSESVVVTLLQKSKDAKRIYATVRGCGTNTDGYKVEGLTKPSCEMQTKLLQDIYEEFNINPLDISYMEAHGTGTQVGDVVETEGLANFLCENRKEPLLIGSVKTNIGHTEMASGLTSIIKVILTMEHGIIPPIIHLNKIGEDLIPVLQGKLKAVTEITPWASGLIGVNSFGVGGTNAHVVLEPNLKKKSSTPKLPECRLVFFSGRNKKVLENFANLVKANSGNWELLSLLDNIFSKPLRFNHDRGYIILDKEKIIEKTDKFKKEDRQVWFVYSGIGSQWPRMGRDLMKLKSFKQSMEECAEALRPFNIDLLEIVTNGDEDVFKNVTNCFISIVAVSICLTDMLKQLDIKPDGLIGHSVGEIGCAYADELISKKEAMLIAHARGVALQAAPSIEGILAVVGLTPEEAHKKLPKGVSIACYNCVDNLTISGPKKLVTDIVDKLKSEGQFAEIVQGANMAYHSKYIEKAGGVLVELLKEIIPESKPCSTKWISTSVKYLEPTSNDDSKKEILHCAEYHRNNLVNEVHFQSAMEKVPKDAIVIEISPKGLLQTIIRRNLGADAKVLALSADKTDNNFKYCLSKLGELFLSGLIPNLLKLYNDTYSFPVSQGTPSLAPLISWEPVMKCKVSYYSPEKYFGESLSVDLMNPSMKYLEGHAVRGKVIYPVMGYVCLAWETFARLHRKSSDEVPIIIENLKIRRMTLLPKDENVVFNVNILTSNGNFEITEGAAVVCEGNIKLLSDSEKAFSEVTLDDLGESNKLPTMTQEDTYYKLRKIGFQYQDLFQAIVECSGCTGKLRWSNHWIPFLDATVHYTAAVTVFPGVFLPESIKKIIIDPETHLEMASKLNNELPMIYDVITNFIRCGGVEIREFEIIELSETKSISKPKLEKYQFTPYNLTTKIKIYDCIHFVIQIVMENRNEIAVLNVLELCDDVTKETNTISQTLKDVLSEEVVIKKIHERRESIDKSKSNEYDLVVIDKELKNGIFDEIKGFLLLRESKYLDENVLRKLDYIVIAKFSTNSGDFILSKSRYIIPKEIEVINITTKSFEWVNQLKVKIKTSRQRSSPIYLVSQNDETCGIIGLFNCLQYEDGGKCIRVIFVPDKISENFSSGSKFYREQMEKDLRVNVYKNSSWGSYRFLPYQSKGMTETDKCHAACTTPGDISRIKMIQSNPYIQNPQEVIHVYYAGMNFKDALIAGGILRLPGVGKNNSEIGFEFSGRKSDGQRVAGVRKYHSFTQMLEPDTVYVKVPDNWTLEEAATVPVIYLTLYYGLFYKTKLEHGKSILIHSASGGVGMAAVQIALNEKCMIFATVGSEQKKTILLKVFPQLDEKNIFNSREDSFEMKIKMMTNGKGVDFVLNALVGDLFNASLRCIASNGHFIEIGKTELLLKSQIESSLFLRSADFHAVSIDEFTVVENIPVMDKIMKMIEDDMRKGYIKPIPYRKVFNIEDISEALKYFQKPYHAGKIIIKVRDEENGLKTPPSIKTMQAIPKVYFNPNKSYIIIGGLGGLGMQCACMLSLGGAKHIVLNSRSKPKHGHQLNLISTIEKWGSKVYLDRKDCSIFENAEKLLAETNAIAPVGGIFNLAMVNEDALIEDQTVEKFEAVFRPKGLVTKNLDILSRKMCPELEHFLVYSSISCGKGNLGQTNYGFANSTIERIIDKRNEDQLPGLAIQWGPIAEVGYFARTSNKDGVGFFVAQPIVSYDNVLQEFLLNSSGILTSFMMRDVVRTLQPGNSLLESLLKLLGITNADKVNEDSSLLELGMDSLMGFEIRQYLYREHNIDMTVSELRNKSLKDIRNIERNHQL